MVGAQKVSRRSKPKGEKRARTRAKLMEAAAEVIGEKGYERASLDEIAARAGMTRGAIYGNFRTREELLFAFVESRWAPARPPLVKGAPLREQLRIIGQTVATSADQRRAAAVGALSFHIFLLTHERMRKRMAAANKQIYSLIGRDLLNYVDERRLPMPLETFVRVLHALGDGLMFCRFLEPEHYTDDVIISAFEALA
jgi:AcrR family transcriptional regulator